MIWTLVWSCAVLCACAKAEQNIRNKYVTTNLDAKWKQTPLIHEVSEYLSEENSEYFWDFVDETCSNQFDAALSDRQRYERLLTLAGRYLSEAQLGLLRLSLSLRRHSPRAALSQQLASQLERPDCAAFVQLGERLLCGAGELAEAAAAAASQPPPETYPVDHHYKEGPAPATAILYGELGTEPLCRLHRELKTLAEAKRIDYVLRQCVKEPAASKVRLSGYGVELAIKSTEYKAQDDTKVKDEGSGDAELQDQHDDVEGFVFSRLRELHPELSANLSAFQRHLVASSADMAPLKVWQLQDLSLQAAQRVAQAPPEEALRLMTGLAQNFPSMARTLIKTKVEKALKTEIKNNHNLYTKSLNLEYADSALFANGMFFDMETTDIFTLFEHLREEQKVMEGLFHLGIPKSAFDDLLRLDLTAASEGFAVDFRDTAVNWINDIERDRQYAKWPSHVTELLRPTYPGMLRTVRKNMYHLVLVLDPSRRSSLDLLTLAQSLFTNQMPFTLGLVLAVTPDPDVTGLQDAGVAMAEAFNYVLREEKAPRAPFKALSFLVDVHAASSGGDVSVEDVKRTLGKLYPAADVADVLGEMSDYDAGRTLARDYVTRLGAGRRRRYGGVCVRVLFNGAPLPVRSISADTVEEAALQELMKALHQFTKAVYRQELTDGDDVAEWIVSQPNVMPRLNDRILKSEKRLVDFSGEPRSTEDAAEFSRLTPRDMSASVGGRLKYVSRPASVRMRPLTYWLAADLESAEGRQLMQEAVLQVKGSREVRLAFLPNPHSPSAENSHNRRALAALQALQGETLIKYLLALSGDKKEPEAALSAEDASALSSALASLGPDALNLWATYVRRVLHVPGGRRALVVNGQMVGPLEPGEAFGEDDFALLEKYTSNSYAGQLETKLLRVMDEMAVDDLSDVMMKASALLNSRTLKKERWTMPSLEDKHSVVRLPPADRSLPAFELVAVCDPVSRGAQQLGPLLAVLHQVLNADVRLVLNAQEKHSDMPLKSYYRLVLEPAPQFSAAGELQGPVARFAGVPGEPILTQHYHVPDNWMVEAVVSPYDLDNIKLDDVEHGVHSDFELEHLLLEGHCFEQSSGSPPRGLQVTLGTARRPVVVDTIVMANLGYFQLKASPGAWTLRLRQGRSADIYNLISLDGQELPERASGVSVVISSFRSHVVKLRVAKKPGMEQLDLLSDETDESSGIWGSIKSTFGAGGGGSSGGEDRLNIFSLASGHLYERLMRIMMLGVLRHTKTPVKFWFLKNYLSPTFKDLLPLMAQRYGFEFELVQYKWPRWLHQQTEKQRIIWGYKILFLDVLFPLDVKKIIFVDADQIVRADLKELRDLDLEGAPYGYTPFCDSRKEMDGFRFWNQGYWRSHLQGRRYHISALYVVDLKKFRQIAAGDRLRGQYQGLSQDPNSLSNLDQDLPNNMIHQVRIKSLPQEWLWCETWCDDASKKHAKTIDLCNNPLTKEAKLKAAVRIAPEWSDYDNEIREFQASVKVGRASASSPGAPTPAPTVEHDHGGEL
ncbi:LOW QUALITY PROTEIN: UDP-glucose:glycoprotein glucosyltransferase 1-like [Pollicipes pollicipes]|uniref:LOW QUALITY PROTEIN: UDP-glucose:glycoprotein glucosyltransferase 1-like n=1 Tax=Pollicipes pollicipes TaxID=41117 RepID=UPI001885847A|nr:LOW QUALITY PROTEIN: UDP-glucose:glycoprotein glucosyltransferase 1-like [Pollicipes pollicipes]